MCPVDGNLNANEISDLKKLIGALGQATTQAQRTGAADPGALLQSISGLSTVAAFDYSYNQNVEDRYSVLTSHRKPFRGLVRYHMGA